MAALAPKIACTDEKMVVDNISQKTCSPIENPEFLLEFDPRPQRTLKLNRRSFFILNREDDKDVRNTFGDVNSCKQSASTEHDISRDRLTSPSAKKIKLYSKSSVTETQKDRKRNFNDTSSKEKQSQGTPPKKKHKPITWP